MSLIFSQLPGRHERHLLRKLDNPLFPEEERVISPSQLLAAQRQDQAELVEFVTGLRSLVQQAIDLKPNEESDVILEIKARLDMAYEQASVLADDQIETKNAIQRLTQVIMNTIRSNAGADPTALHELQQEEIARNTHYSMLRYPIVADLLHPESTILEDELAPTLLSEDPQGLQAALELFDSTSCRSSAKTRPGC